MKSSGFALVVAGLFIAGADTVLAQERAAVQQTVTFGVRSSLPVPALSEDALSPVDLKITVSPVGHPSLARLSTQDDLFRQEERDTNASPDRRRPHVIVTIVSD